MKWLRPRRRRFLRGTEGATAVELAIGLPILLLFICGIIDFGQIYHYTQMVNEAAREGARIAAVGGTQDNVTTAVNNFGNQLQFTMVPTSPVPTQSVTVQVTRDVTLITPMIGALFPSNPYTVTGRTVMRVE